MEVELDEEGKRKKNFGSPPQKNKKQKQKAKSKKQLKIIIQAVTKIVGVYSYISLPIISYYIIQNIVYIHGDTMDIESSMISMIFIQC